MPTKGKEGAKSQPESLETFYDTNQVLLQARRTETQLTTDPAPRCSFSFRGIEELIRGAGSCALPAVLKVRWRREVTWEKAVRVVGT